MYFFLIKQINIIDCNKVYLRERKNRGTSIFGFIRTKKGKFQPQNLNSADASNA
jgi:hypothetical protein